MNKLILTLSILFAAMNSSAAIYALDGQETHGGNIVLAEFWTHHHYITRTLALCPAAQSNYLAKTWLTKNKLVEVKSAHKVFVGANLDQEVVASNRPKANPPLILISETRWPALNEIEKTKIVMHEVLPVLGVVDSSYNYSDQLYTVYFDCLAPKFGHKNIVDTIIKCEEAIIERWSAAEMSAMRPSAFTAATFHHCLPAIVKMQKYGHRLGTCESNGDDPEYQVSQLMNVIGGYSPGHPRAEIVMDFIMSTNTSELASECDPQFAKACKYIQTRLTGLDKPSTLLTLSEKLSCSK